MIMTTIKKWTTNENKSQILSIIFDVKKYDSSLINFLAHKSG